MNGDEKKDRGKRSTDLIVNFVDGFAEGWCFAVGDFFKNELDIKYTQRLVNGKKVMQWTQGPYYAFAEGHIIYDTPKAYLAWNQALEHINLICEVVRAEPNIFDENNVFRNGTVMFNLSKPNASKTDIEDIGAYHLSQDDFVEFLKSGKLDEKAAQFSK